jgi:hypothetical protein
MTIKKMIGAAALMGVMASANAASLSLVYTGENAVVDGVVQAEAGDALTFDLIMDFSGMQMIGDSMQSEITLGGGFDIAFDSSLLAFDSYVGNENAGFESSFTRDPEVEDGLLTGGAFGAFGGLTGPDLVATITFIAAEGPGGATTIALGADTSGTAGPFVSAIDFATLLNVEFGSVDVEVAPIPVPAAVWFMLSGLGALVGFGRKSA